MCRHRETGILPLSQGKARLLYLQQRALQKAGQMPPLPRCRGLHMPGCQIDCPGHFWETRTLMTTHVQFGVSCVRGTDGRVFPQCQNCLMTPNSQTTQVHLAAVCQVVSIPLDSWLLANTDSFIPVLITNVNSQITHH